MQLTRLRASVLACLLVALTAATGRAAPITILIGDNDGYGPGVNAADNGPAIWPVNPNANPLGYDGRSAAEAAAADGAQFTDVYSALFPGLGPNGVSTGNVVFALPAGQPLTSGTLTIDMGDFQAPQFGQFLVSFNGVAQPGLFNFNDGFQNTAIHTFPLSPAAIANANAAGQFVLTVNRNGSGDFVAFDFFRLDAEVAAVPEPSTLALVGLFGPAAGLYARRFGRRAA